MPNVYTKSGELSSYGLSCGYVERVDVNNIWLDLYQESNIYTVKSYDYEEHRPILVYVFDNLQDARSIFRKCRTELKTTGNLRYRKLK